MNNILHDFGKKIRDLRVERGLSQEKLAELSGLHRTYISALERGMRSVSLKNIERLAGSLGVNVYELFIFSED